jgi:hypothetical protein
LSIKIATLSLFLDLPFRLISLHFLTLIGSFPPQLRPFALISSEIALFSFLSQFLTEFYVSFGEHSNRPFIVDFEVTAFSQQQNPFRTRISCGTVRDFELENITIYSRTKNGHQID